MDFEGSNLKIAAFRYSLYLSAPNRIHHPRQNQIHPNFSTLLIPGFAILQTIGLPFVEPSPDFLLECIARTNEHVPVVTHGP